MAANRYHKGYTPQEARAAKTQTMRDRRDTEVRDKEVIVWDGEGMKLSGDDKSQHYVLFGCSVRPDSPLVIDHPTGRLLFEEIADYCLDVAAEHPHAIHLGYYFKYDQNMIIWSLHWLEKIRLYERGACAIMRGKTRYYIRLILGKNIHITRTNARGEKCGITIEDFAPFFASSFVVAYEKLFPVPTDPEQWEIVKQGKADRSVMQYQDMGKVRRYWRAEILALQELASEFRDLMFRADFILHRWHGPGALADYIRRKNRLVEHEWGGKEDNLTPDLHLAIKCGYVGGHFEPYMVGWIPGPIHSYDKNSAYPHAFTQIPSLAEGGWWEHIDAVSPEQWNNDRDLATSFAIFRVRWVGGTSSGIPLGNRYIQPLPHRDKNGAITYPMRTTGWYWAPEVCIARLIADHNPDVVCDIIEGWRWHPLNGELWPWQAVLENMYARRLVLKNNRNPTQMAFKLGPNSMYGKSAQRVGGSNGKPPRSHTLCIAGYVTSTCRAAVMDLMRHCGQDEVISVETDGVYTRTPPERLPPRRFPMSEKLGEWEHTVYDDMIILQSGVYLLRQGDEWTVKTRGFSARAFQDENGKGDPHKALDHLRKCEIGEPWPAMRWVDGEGFLGLGTAIQRASTRLVAGPNAGQWSVNPFKAQDLHCTWVPNHTSLDIEGHGGKRSHWAQHCRACTRGESPADVPHDMVIHSITDIDPREIESYPYQLPWEKETGEERWRHLNEQEADRDL